MSKDTVFSSNFTIFIHFLGKLQKKKIKIPSIRERHTEQNDEVAEDAPTTSSLNNHFLDRWEFTRFSHAFLLAHKGGLPL